MKVKYDINRIYKMRELDNVLDGQPPKEILNKSEDSFDINDRYFKIDSDCKLKSFLTRDIAERYMGITRSIKILKEVENPAVILDITNNHIMKSGNREDLSYLLKNYQDQNAEIVSLPKDNRYIDGLIRRPWLLYEFHQITKNIYTDKGD